LDDRHIGMEQLLREEALKVFIDWAGKTDKMKY